MNERTISMLKVVRKGLQVGYEPLDKLNRFANYKKGYPPLYIRQRVGGLNDFESSGSEYLAYLKLLCNLQPGDKVLDIGCGCGLMCLPVNENSTLPEYLGLEGRYVGIDIDKSLIEWCKKNIRHPVCQFRLVEEGLEAYRFNVILCKSLFTHLLPTETIDYISYIKGYLTEGGSCLTTWFLLNWEEPITPKGRYTFKDQHTTYSLERGSNKRHAVAYQEAWIIEMLKNAGFEPELYPGSWRGNNKGLSFQDIIILRR